ncbi:unnamed protein product [Ostreobium quekettii]|uniref:aspartate kinase n=1 Tax=Ostreobium quekettii TaxID=121088 RepID=A0A8S1IWF5_9CHLO|nr:unnamed protein product [Ostreobium quekettii]|eukprot:evm.model.scf_439.4 EVM.evm.TU.scf_439.4   scf_439:29676-31520(-)
MESTGCPIGVGAGLVLHAPRADFRDPPPKPSERDLPTNQSARAKMADALPLRPGASAGPAPGRARRGRPLSSRPPRRGPRVAAAAASDVQRARRAPGQHLKQISTVYKFGGSSVATADHMVEVADIVCSFPDELPCVVLSAMGKTTNQLLAAADMALSVEPEAVESIPPVRDIEALHAAAVADLGVDQATRDQVGRLLAELKMLLRGISIVQECTPRARDSVISFGERLSTRIFAALLAREGVPARQYDAWDLGFVSTDEFTNADVIFDATLPAIRRTLSERDAPGEVPVVTGFLAHGANTGAITTLGRGGSDLTATTIGAALGVDEVQVWKDVDGVLTTDPRVVPGAYTVPLLTFDEATELAYYGAQVLHPQAMRPARLADGELGVRVKNSYNRYATGTLIKPWRDMSLALLTSIVLKRDVTLVDIASTRMVGQHGFLARVFEMFGRAGISVDVVATSEVSVSTTLDVNRLWTHKVVDSELQQFAAGFEGWADVTFRRGSAIVSLICNVERSSEILERVFRTLGAEGINVQMISQGASKTNISFLINDSEAERAARALHQAFFGQ